MTKKFPTHPERVCWGCDQYCAANDMHCGNGSDRTPHPVELLGEDWREWNQGRAEPTPETPPSATPPEESTLP